MAINQTFTAAPPSLIAPWAYQVGHATGSKENLLKSLEAGQQSAQIAQRGALAQMEMAQRAGLAQMDFQNAREARMAQLYGNAQDNERMLQQEQIQAQARLQQEQLQQSAYDDRATMEADLRLRNDTMTKGLGGIHVPDVTQGPAQNFDLALANQDVFKAVAGRDRTKLLEKFQAGDPQAIQSALNSGRARLGDEEQKALNQLNSEMMKSFEDTTLRPKMRAALQAQLAQKIAAIKARAQWLPDEQQPKSLQEQMQSRVVTVQDPTNPNRMVPAIVNSKGDLEPFHTFEKEAKPDPNAPKPLDPVKVREQHEKAYDAAFKTLIRPDAQGNPVPPKDEEVMQYLQRRKAAVDAIMSGQPMPGQWTQPTYNEDGTRAAPAPAPMQSPTAPLTEVGSAITGTQPSQQIPPPPSPNQPAIKQAGNTIKFGESDLPVRMSIPLQDGGNMPIVDVKMHGKYLSATPSKNGDGMLLLRRGEGGEILTIGQIKSPNSGTVEDPIVAPDKATWDYLEEAFPNGTWITDGIDRYQLKKPD